MSLADGECIFCGEAPATSDFDMEEIDWSTVKLAHPFRAE